MNIMCIGDVVGQAGCDALSRVLPPLIKHRNIDFVIANGENLADGIGMTPESAEQLFAAGVHVITGGNHSWDRPEGVALLKTDPRVLRPANYPKHEEGRGAGIYTTRTGHPVGVLNLQGRVFLPDNQNPFRVADRLLDKISQETRIVVVDLHAEATSEKMAMGHHLDGRVSIVFGTHTHVPTADAKILGAGTAYVSDVGMTGSYDSVIGFDKNVALRRFLTSEPGQLLPTWGEDRFLGLLVRVDYRDGIALSVEHMNIPVNQTGPLGCQMLKGQPVAKAVEEQVHHRVNRLRDKGIVPKLVLLSVGDDPASKVYLGRKEQAAGRVGIEVIQHKWQADADPQDVLRALEELGADKSVHGVLLQLPLPEGWNSQHLLDHLPPKKDVDGLHPVNAGKLALGQDGFVPCTPLGILSLLRHYQHDPSHKNVVVMGRSAIVGKPTANLLAMKGIDATVTLAHSRSRDLPAICRQADILIVAVGRPQMVTAEYVKSGAVVVDVGIHRVDDPANPGKTRLVGDVAADSVKEVAGALSPVPGGVGPLTVSFLLNNTVKAAEQIQGMTGTPDGTLEQAAGKPKGSS